MQETQYILSNMSELLFFYQSLFLYSLCEAGVAGRLGAVSLSLGVFVVVVIVVVLVVVFSWCVQMCVLFWPVRSGAGGHGS